MAADKTLTLVKTNVDDGVYHFVYNADRISATKGLGFGSYLEVVAIRHLVPSKEVTGHDSICISISPSCYQTPGCRYCATGEVSIATDSRDLKLELNEVIDQVKLTIEEVRKYDSSFGEGNLSVSYMGKGEPLLSPENVLESLEILYRDGAITRSCLATTGHPKLFRRFADTYKPYANRFSAPYLQLSIHAPLDEDRAVLVRNPRFQKPIEEIIRSAIEDYALTVLPPKTFITLRFTLMRWDDKCNYDNRSLDELSRLVHMFNDKYSSSEFGGLIVVAALLNETESSKTQGIRSATRKELHEVIEGLSSRGIDTRFFAGNSIRSIVGGCGTFSEIKS